MIIPMTAPRKIFPPNTLAADTATRIGRKVKAVFENKSRIPYQSLPAKAGIALPSASTSPIIRPEATIAGRIGTKTSPSALNIRLNTGCFAAAAAFTSSLVAALIPLIAINSSYTLFTVPVPMMSCSCPLLLKTPFTSSIFSSFFISILLLSTVTRRSLVAQCAALTRLALPPAASKISFAHFA